MLRGGYHRHTASRSGVPPPERHLTLTAKEKRSLQQVYVKVVLGLPTDYQGVLPKIKPGLFLGLHSESHFARMPQLPISSHTLPLEP